MFNKKNSNKNGYMLEGKYKRHGYDWWWHSFTGYCEKEERQFFIEYFIINPKVSKDKPTFGRLGEKPSYVMLKCGSWGSGKSQLHKFYPVSSVEIKKAPYELKGEDFYASDTLIKGDVKITDSKNHPEWMCDDGEMSFELKIDKNIAFNVGYGTSPLLRKMKAFEMYWHAEGMKSYYDGYVIYNGKKYIVSPETSNGYADKNWGKNFTSPWIWLSSNNIINRQNGEKLNNTVFDIGGGRPKVFFVPLKNKLLSALYVEGKEYEFNFSKFWRRNKTKFDCKIEGDILIWDITQKANKYVMETHMECNINDMLFVNYESPDGKKRYNHLYNGGNAHGNIKLYKLMSKKKVLIHDLDVINAGAEYGVYDN
jgi:hypothetical protein